MPPEGSYPWVTLRFYNSRGHQVFVGHAQAVDQGGTTSNGFFAVIGAGHYATGATHCTGTILRDGT